MKRRGIKVASLISSIISGIIIFFIYFLTGLIYYDIFTTPSTGEPNGMGILYLLGIIFMTAISFLIGDLNIACIVMNAIDINKTKKEQGSIKRSVVFLILNIVYLLLSGGYIFVLGILGKIAQMT